MQGKKILITGATGQVGSAIARSLAADNEVWGLARFTVAGSRELMEADNIRPFERDYTSGDFTGLPDDFNYVLHLGANLDPPTIDEGLRQNAESTAMLFQHCRKAQAWLYSSASGVYWDNPDPFYRYHESDRVGGSTRITTRFHYAMSKWAGEIATRSASRILGVPAVIARFSWAYSTTGNGGLPGTTLTRVASGLPVEFHSAWPMVGTPIFESDIVATIEPFLDSAVVGAHVINWGGDEIITLEELAHYGAELMGTQAKIKRVESSRFYPRALDTAKRRAIAGPCEVDWREGVRRIVTHRSSLRSAELPPPTRAADVG